MLDVRDFFASIHESMKPRNYFETDVKEGAPWMMVKRNIPSIGIDPSPNLKFSPSGSAKLFVGSSTSFFDQFNPKEIFGTEIDLAHISGKSDFEEVLNDFAKIERFSTASTSLIVSDCLLSNEKEYRKNDLWKLVVCLRDVRPDLEVRVFDVGPNGLALIRNLDPDAFLFREELPVYIRKFASLPRTYLGDSDTAKKLLFACEAQVDEIRNIYGRERLVEHAIQAEIEAIEKIFSKIKPRSIDSIVRCHH